MLLISSFVIVLVFINKRGPLLIYFVKKFYINFLNEIKVEKL